MASTDDPNADVRRFKNERQRVKDAEIHSEDRTALLNFGDHLRGDRAPSTAYQNVASCRRVAVRAEAIGSAPIAEWNENSFNRFMVRMQDADFPPEHRPKRGNWSEGTLRNFRQHVKNLLVYLNHDWASEIEVGAPPDPSVERGDLLKQEELTALWEAAEHPRDECLIALPLATWQRNAAVRALRVRDVTLPSEGDRTGYITLRDEALGQKDAEGKRPLTWATGPVERYLQKHPQRDDPEFQDAPLLCIITDAGDAEKGSAFGSAETYNRRLRTLAERAGLDRDRYVSSAGRRERTIRAHILRYTGITRAAISDEYQDTNIKKWAGWEMDTPQLKRYVQVIEEDVLAAADEAYGITSALPERPQFDNCPRCGSPVEEWHRACPNCTVLLSDSLWELEETANEIEDEITETALTQNLSADEREGLRVLLEVIDDPEELAARLSDLGH